MSSLFVNNGDLWRRGGRQGLVVTGSRPTRWRIGPWYRVKDRWSGYVFWALTRNHRDKRELIRMKVGEDVERGIIESIVKHVGWFIRGRFDVVTTPPWSGEGMDWAGMIGKRVGAEADIDFVSVFRAHGKGKRYNRRVKAMGGLDYVSMVDLERKRVFVFDDFATSRRTMVGALKALGRKNQVYGFVLAY